MPEQRHLFDREIAVVTYLPDEEPTHRLVTHGSTTLSDAELVAIVTDMPLHAARALLTGGLTVFARRSWEIGGHGSVSQKTAAKIAASLELGRRIATYEPEEGQPFNRESLGRTLAIRFGDAVQERLGAIFLTTRGTPIAERILTIGTLDHACAEPREVFRLALAYHAAQVIVFHNHPSGSVSPSKDDMGLTQRLKDAGTILGVTLLDHIIVGKASYYSMQQHGFL